MSSRPFTRSFSLEPGLLVVLIGNDGKEVGRGKIFQVEGRAQGESLRENHICVVDVTELKIEKWRELPHPSETSGRTFQEAESRHGGVMRVVWDVIRLSPGMFENQARAERYNISKSLFACKLAEGNLVSPHVIKMIGYIKSLEKLGFPLSQELATDVILQSLPPSFEPVILNFHMNSMEKSMTELHGMLKLVESIKKNSNHVMMIQKTTNIKKKNYKALSKRKGMGKTRDEISSTKSKLQKLNVGAASDAICYHCQGTGHWKRNCKKYLAELKKKKERANKK